MPVVVSVKPFFAVFVSLFLVPVLLSCRSPNVREAWTFVAAAVKFLLILSMLPEVMSGTEIVTHVAEVLPGLEIKFRVDALGMLFALVSSFLWIVTTAYSIGYMRGLAEHSQTRYFCYFSLALSATIGVAFSANLLTLYLFYEMLSLATYPLVTHHQDAEARSSGRKYLLYILGTSIALVLPAMLICYNLSGTLEFSSKGILGMDAGTPLVVTLLLMFVFGFAKAAVMPLHSWLPAAMVAPTPVSALLHAVAVVKVGAFSILRAVTGILGVDLLRNLHAGTIVCVLASATFLIASLIALSQDGLKRRLAFSTIGQLSYIVLGVALLSPKALMGGAVHIAMHAFGKITLFFCAGAIFVAGGKTRVSELTGIGIRMPFTMAAFFLGAMSVIGLPPTGGFISKWYLVLGTLEAKQWVFLVALLASSLLNAAYFLPIVYRAFFIVPEETSHDVSIHEAPPWCLVPLGITAAGSVVLFFYPEVFLGLAQIAAERLFGG